MTSKDLSYLLDEDFLMEGIKRIDDVLDDDSLKDKESTSHSAEGVGEDSDESDVEDNDESNDSQDDRHAQGNPVSCKESQAGGQNRVALTAGQSASTLRSSASATSNDEHIALSRLPRASYRRSDARISTGRDVLDDSSTTLEGIAFTAETIETATKNCRLIDTTPIIPANRQARLSGRQISSPNGVGGSSASNGERVNVADVLVSLMANMNFEADDGDDEVQCSAMAKNTTSSASQLQTPQLNRLLNSSFLASRGTRRSRGGRASIGTSEDPLTKQIGFFGELFIFTFLRGLLGSTNFQEEDGWTSANRTLAFPDKPFTGSEGRFSDFTFSDPEGKLGQHLSERSSNLGYVDSKTTYHLEVKATNEDLSNPFFMSSNQMNMAMNHSSLGRRDRVPATDVYVVARVYDIVLGGQTHAPKVCFLVDPWRMMLEGSLKFGIKWTLQVS